MLLIDALQKLKALDLPTLRTDEVAGVLNINRDHASQILRRLTQAGEMMKLKRSVWGFVERLEPFMLPELLTAPLPSYISLHTALYFHGLISQIPDITYAVSIARTRRFRTQLGDVSIHHIQPDFFTGYTIINEKQIKMATPEKALIDFLYLKPAKSKFFHSLPEVDLSSNFDTRHAYDFISMIPAQQHKTRVKQSFEELVALNK